MASYQENFSLLYPAIIPPEIISDKNLTDRDFRIYTVIHSIIGNKKNGFCTLTNLQIASASGKEIRAVERALSILAQKEFIFIDTDHTRNKKNQAIRHIYTSEKYFKERFNVNNEIKVPTQFKNIHHFRNFVKIHAIGFSFKYTKKDGAKVPLIITDKGYLKNTILNTTLHPTKDKELIYGAWEALFKNSNLLKDYINKKKEN